MSELRLPSTIASFRSVIGGSLYRFFYLNVRLSSGKNLAHLDNVLHEVFVQGVSNLQPADKCEGDNFLLIIWRLWLVGSGRSECMT